MKANLLKKIRSQFHIKVTKDSYIAIHKYNHNVFYEFYLSYFIIDRILSDIGFSSRKKERIYHKSIMLLNANKREEKHSRLEREKLLKKMMG